MASAIEHAPTRPRRGSWRVRRGPLIDCAGVGVLALAVRLSLVLASPGGLTGNLSDDAAAYYAGADAIVHGRLPYRDFVLLHPPLLDLFLTPFAAIGALTSDHAGFVAATLATEAIGALNAGLIVLVGHRLGLGRWPVRLAGTFYAVWFSAVVADMGVRLETVANLLFLLGLLALTKSGRRYVVLAGAALGGAATVKIWGAVPALVAVGWYVVVRRRPAHAGWLAAGIAGATLLVCGPFFLASPRSMWRMVIIDQLTRRVDERPRLPQLTAMADVFPDLDGAALTAMLTVVSAAVVVVLALALRVPSVRLVTVIAIIELALLLLSPSYFPYYGAFAAPAVAISLGAAAGPSAARSSPRLAQLVGPGLATVVVAAAGIVLAFAIASVPQDVATRKFPRAAVARALAGTHCPMPDGPMVLIQTDQLTRTLADGCPNWIDVSGRVYDIDKAPQGADYPRSLNAKWQRDLRRYLLSGDRVILFRPGIGIGPTLRREIEQLPLLVDADGVTVYAVPAGLAAAQSPAVRHRERT